MSSEWVAFGTGLMVGLLVTIILLSGFFNFSNSDLLEAKLAEYNKTTGVLELIDIEKIRETPED